MFFALSFSEPLHLIRRHCVWNSRIAQPSWSTLGPRDAIPTAGATQGRRGAEDNGHGHSLEAGMNVLRGGDLAA